MEFRMTTDMTVATPQEITFNYDELKVQLTERLDYYNKLVVTPDTIKEGKDDRANLRKLKDALDTRRKEIKKQWNAPLAAFEAKVKDLTCLIDKPIEAIDGQIKLYEEQEKEKKRAEIAEAYDTIVPADLRDIIPMTLIFNPKWLNATTKMSAVEKELTIIVKRTSADLLVINTVEPEYATAVKEVYMRTLDIEKALSHKKALQEAAKAFEARENTQLAEDVKQPTAAPREQETRQEAEPPKSSDDKLYALRLEFHLTKDQAAALKKFLADARIDYTKI